MLIFLINIIEKSTEMIKEYEEAIVAFDSFCLFCALKLHAGITDIIYIHTGPESK